MELLAEAAPIEPAEREAYLAAKTPDSSLREEVLSLLAVRTPTGDLLEQAVIDWYRPEPASPGDSSGPPRMMVGEIVANRFRIKTFLGRGGMGEVYAVEDCELHQQVALKLLHPELASQEGFLDRFRREIRLARSISHPNVARVFDLVQEPGHPLGNLYFYVLELLKGETLGARIKRAGPLPAGEALVIARQMAAGLSAVHASGVLHRDFKPANVILTEGRAVVSDFGLAVPIVWETRQAALATTSLLLGTPGYVAPEQWAGKPATVATDVYSFGIVLHEMITGRHPNAAGPKLEGEWGRVVSRCLELDPDNRWPSPSDAVEALQPGILSRRNLVRAGVAASALAGAGYAALQFLNRVRVQPGAKIMIAGIRNLTGDPKFDGIATALRSNIGQSAFLNIISPGDLVQHLAPMLVNPRSTPTLDQSREAAWRSNAAAVVFGRFALVGSAPTLTLEVEWRGKQPQEPASRESKSFSSPGWIQVSQSLRAAGNWVRSMLGDRSFQSAIYDRPPEQLTTPSWEALMYFTRAEDHAYGQRHQEAMLDFSSALKLDPGFSLASMRKAATLNSMGLDLDSMRAWQDAILLLNVRPGSRRDELFTLGSYNLDTHCFGKAEEYFTKLSFEYPHDARGYFYRSTPMLLAGRARDLKDLLLTASRIDSEFFLTYTAMLPAALLTQDDALFQRAVEKLTALGKDHYAHLGQTSLGWYSGDQTLLLKHCELLQNASDSRSRCEGFIQAGNFFAETGQHSTAESMYRNAASLQRDPRIADLRLRAWTGVAYTLVSQKQFKMLPAVIESMTDAQESVDGFMHSAVVAARSRDYVASKAWVERLRGCPDVVKTRVAIDMALLEQARMGEDATTARQVSARLIKALPKFGPHTCAPLETGLRPSANQSSLAAVPLFFWLHTHHYRAGDFGALLRNRLEVIADQPRNPQPLGRDNGTIWMK